MTDSSNLKSQSDPPLLRHAGILEWFLYARAAVGADSCVIVAARYENATGGALDKQTLFPALRHVVRQNAALSARLAPAPDGRRPPSWIRLASLDLSDVVDFVSEASGDLGAMIESQLERGFDVDADLPLWRLAVHHDGMVLLAFDHVLGDGKSGLAIHKMLLDALNKQVGLSAPDDGKVTDLPQDSALPPSLEESTAVPIPIFKVLSELLATLNPFAWRRYSKTWGGNPVPERFELPVTVRITQYTPSETARILQRARAHSAALTAVLHTLVLVVLSRLIHARGLDASYKYALTIVPISLRRITGAGPDDMCNHYSMYHPQNTLYAPVALASDAFPWEDAARFAQALKREVPRSASTMGMLKLVGATASPEAFVRSPLGRKRVAAVELSNLGAFGDGGARLPPETETDDGPWNWKIRETMFAVADGTLGPALKVSVVGTPAGGLGVAVSWGKNAVERDFAEEFVSMFRDSIQKWLLG